MVIFLLLVSRLPAASTRTKSVRQLGNCEDALAVELLAVFLRHPGQETQVIFSLACARHRFWNSQWPQCRFKTSSGGALPRNSVALSLIRFRASLERATVLTLRVA